MRRLVLAAGRVCRRAAPAVSGARRGWLGAVGGGLAVGVGLAAGSGREALVEAYVDQLMEDEHLYKLSVLGYSRPLWLERPMFRLIVGELAELFASTVQGWNRQPAGLFGHPIVHELSPTGGLRHHPIAEGEMVMYEVMAEQLAGDPRVCTGIYPHGLEVVAIENTLRVMSVVFKDFLLSSRVEVMGGALKMDWRLDPAREQAASTALAADSTRIRAVVAQALETVDFEAVDREADRMLRGAGPLVASIPGMHGHLAQAVALALVFFQLGRLLEHNEASCAGTRVEMVMQKPPA